MKFSLFDEGEVRKLSIEGCPDIADRIMKKAHAIERDTNTRPIGLVLGPMEYLGLAGYLSGMHGMGGVIRPDEFLGMRIELKSTPGVDLIFEDKWDTALRLASQMILVSNHKSGAKDE